MINYLRFVQVWTSEHAIPTKPLNVPNCSKLGMGTNKPSLIRGRIIHVYLFILKMHHVKSFGQTACEVYLFC